VGIEPPYSYSVVADRQLDEILNLGRNDLYNDLVTVCEAILDDTSTARSQSSAITTNEGIRFRFAVPGRYPYKVFWRADFPAIEAVFPYST
jgi:hypothetical protein